MALPLTGQDAYYINITYWVDVEKARATQDKMKLEKLKSDSDSSSDSHLFDNLYVDNPWFSNEDFMDLLEFTKKVIFERNISCSVKVCFYFCSQLVLTMMSVYMPKQGRGSVCIVHTGPPVAKWSLSR